MEGMVELVFVWPPVYSTALSPLRSSKQNAGKLKLKEEVGEGSKEQKDALFPTTPTP
jgi:hypothetical protein